MIYMTGSEPKEHKWDFLKNQNKHSNKNQIMHKKLEQKDTADFQDQHSTMIIKNTCNEGEKNTLSQHITHNWSMLLVPLCFYTNYISMILGKKKKKTMNSVALHTTLHSKQLKSTVITNYKNELNFQQNRKFQFTIIWLLIICYNS